jgi:hypothetical protein
VWLGRVLFRYVSDYHIVSVESQKSGSWRRIIANYSVSFTFACGSFVNKTWFLTKLTLLTTHLDKVVNWLIYGRFGAVFQVRARFLGRVPNDRPLELNYLRHFTVFIVCTVTCRKFSLSKSEFADSIKSFLFFFRRINCLHTGILGCYNLTLLWRLGSFDSQNPSWVICRIHIVLSNSLVLRSVFLLFFFLFLEIFFSCVAILV